MCNWATNLTKSAPNIAFHLDDHGSKMTMTSAILLHSLF